MAPELPMRPQETTRGNLSRTGREPGSFLDQGFRRSAGEMLKGTIGGGG